MKSKEKKKTDIKRPIVLIGTQNKKSSNLILSLIVKLLLIYILCAGTLMCFASFYNLPYELSSAVQHILLYVTPLFPVFLVVKKRFIIPCILISCIICYHFQYEAINEALLLLRDHILLALDGRLLQTAQFVPHNSLAFLIKTQKYAAGMNIAMLIISGFICLITVFLVHRKFSGIGTVIMWLILYTPAFVAEKADYNLYVLLIIPAFFALYSISSSNLSEEERLLARRAGKTKKKNKPQTHIYSVESAINELSKYSRNCLCGILSGVIAFSVFFTSQSFFPGLSSFDVNDAVNAITEFISDAGDYIGSIFSGEGGSKFNNYFSNDNFFSGNDIEIKAPPFSSDKPVLDVKSDKPDSFYLIGDVGVEFTGNSWISVMKKEKNGELSYEGYNIDKNFDPDLLYQIYIASLIAPGSDNVSTDYISFSQSDEAFAKKHLKDYYDTIISYNIAGNDVTFTILRNIASYSHINIEYHQNTDIVFKPYIPGNTSYASNGQFSVFADSIIRISDKKNWIKNFETDVISPRYSLWFASDTSNRLSASTTRETLHSIGLSGNEIDSFKKNKQEYDRYIKDNYSHVPNSEKENMRRLLNEFESSYNISPSSIGSDYMYAFALCEYLKHEYKYSLTANNSSDSEHTVLGKFLFDTKEGHCALYASSMVLALREHGLPARYISGFSTGTLELNEITGLYEKTMAEKNLHAWVEVYFPEYGWMAFDPTGWSDDSTPSTNTPSSPESTTTSNDIITTPPVSSSSTSKTTTPPPVSVTTSDKNGGSSPTTDKDNNNPFFTIIIVAIIVILLAATIYGTIVTVQNKNSSRWKSFATGDSTVSAKEMHKFIMKLFTTTDITPEISELPTAFALRVDALMNISDKRNNLQEIMRIIEKAEFSAKGISDEERKQVYIYTKMLYDLVMKSAGRLKRIYLKIFL